MNNEVFYFVGVCVVSPSNRKFNVTVVQEPAAAGLQQPALPPQQPSPIPSRARPNKLPFASIPEDHPLQLAEEDKCGARSRSQTPDPGWDFGDNNGQVRNNDIVCISIRI